MINQIITHLKGAEFSPNRFIRRRHPHRLEHIRILVCRESIREEWHPFIIDCFGCTVSMPSWVASGTMAGVGRASAISARQAFL